MANALRSIRRSDNTTRLSPSVSGLLTVGASSGRWPLSEGFTASAARWRQPSAGSTGRRGATAAPRRSRWRCWSSNAASCGWSAKSLHRARPWFEAAVRRLPAYVPAHGHLAELDAAQRKTVPAIARLRTLALGSDDPDYATQLARILSDVRQAEEAELWRGRAEARYEELLTRHPDAFADHGAEFWLRVGGDPVRALALAKHNLELRPTPRARALYEAAAAKAHSAETRIHDSSRAVEVRSYPARLRRRLGSTSEAARSRAGSGLWRRICHSGADATTAPQRRAIAGVDASVPARFCRRRPMRRDP